LERSVIATILVWYNAAALTNFLPVLEMDGYFILAHLCRMPNLRADAYEHIKRRLLRLVRGRDEGLAQFSLSASILLLAYAVVSFVASVSMVLLLPYSAYYRKMPMWETSALALTLFVVYFGSTARRLMFRGAETKA
jgi:Zn-dependent protease